MNRLSILRTLFPRRADAGGPARRWARAFRQQPELKADIAAFGGVLSLRTEEYRDGVAVPHPIDPVRLAYDQGRRDMALQLLALDLTPLEFSTLTESFDD